MAKLSEARLVQQYLRPLCDEKVARNLADDSAELPHGNYIISTDNLVEGVHFLPSATPAQIACRLLGRNLSDMAGSAARPLYYLLNWVVTERQDETWVAEFCDTLQQWQERHGMRLIGGDGSKGAALSLSMTIIGEPLRTPSPTRAHAKVGDGIFVSGTIGNGYLGLQALRGEATGLADSVTEICKNHYYNPPVRCDLMARIIGFLGHDLHGSMDISDGLILDCGRLMEASNTSAEIDLQKIPLLAGVDNHLLPELMGGGDDYELLFTVAESRIGEFCDYIKKHNLPLQKIGKIIVAKSSPSVQFYNDGEEVQLPSAGWQITYGGNDAK